ncbi:MAG: hypothetical protein HY690_10785 [Chloroflexi bacterium]|nr:hypothetical protein [Chloroflexota bacterium]
MPSSTASSDPTAFGAGSAEAISWPPSAGLGRSAGGPAPPPSEGKPRCRLLGQKTSSSSPSATSRYQNRRIVRFWILDFGFWILD